MILDESFLMGGWFVLQKDPTLVLITIMWRARVGVRVSIVVYCKGRAKRYG